MSLGLGAKIERYVFLKGFVAFALTTIVLVVIVWLTQALREIDLVTAKGQTLQLFLIMSSLAVPSLIVVLAPVALLIASIYVLSSLHTDSELVIIAASGGSPKRVTRPLLWLSLVVALITGFLSVYLAPNSLQQLRGLTTQVRADLISSIMVPGAFTDVDSGLIVHIKERNPDGSLAGIMISDTRDPATSFKYLAERGALVETGPSTYLVMQNGNILRREQESNSSSIIEFASYGFDLSQFRETAEVDGFRPKEQSMSELFGQLGEVGLGDKDLREYSVEFHTRLVAPAYAFTMCMIAILFLASPQTTRTGRGVAIVMAACAATLLRGLGFAVESLAEDSAVGIPVLYALPTGATVLCLFLLWQNVRLDFAQRTAERLSEFLVRQMRRLAPRIADSLEAPPHQGLR